MEARSDRTAIDVSLLLVRLVVGITFLLHGSQIMFGAFGGQGLAKFVEMQGPLGYLVAIGQFFGGLGLVTGVLTRFSAAALIVIMLGAIVMVHLPHGFFAKDNGFELNVALIGLLLPVLIAGPGRFTLARPLPFLGRAGEPPHLMIE